MLLTKVMSSFQIPLHEPVKETPVIQPLEEEEPLSLSADGQAVEVPCEEEQEDVEGEEEPEGLGSEPEAPLEDVSSEPAESGTNLISTYTFQLRDFFVPLL